MKPEVRYKWLGKALGRCSGAFQQICTCTMNEDTCHVLFKMYQNFWVRPSPDSISISGVRYFQGQLRCRTNRATTTANAILSARPRKTTCKIRRNTFLVAFRRQILILVFVFCSFWLFAFPFGTLSSFSIWELAFLTSLKTCSLIGWRYHDISWSGPTA